MKVLKRIFNTFWLTLASLFVIASVLFLIILLYIAKLIRWMLHKGASLSAQS